MIRILKFLWTGKWRYCFHKWTFVRSYSIMGNGYKNPVGEKQVLECANCGERKVFNV
jgi:hypothetical protein